MSRTFWYYLWISLLTIGFLLSVFFRHPIHEFILAQSPDTLQGFSRMWVDIVVPVLVACIATITFFYRKHSHRWFLPFWVSIGLAGLIALFLQEVLFSTTSQTFFDYFFPLRRTITFPSPHITVMTAMTIAFSHLHKRGSILLFFLAIATGMFELTSLDHVLSDILGGALLGSLCAAFIIHLERDYLAITKVSHALHQDLEMRRQIAHALLGLTIVTLLSFGLLNAPLLGVICIIGGLLSYLSKRMYIPIIYPLLHFFERQHHMQKFPGRGPFFFVLGAFFCTLLFSKEIALASIMILGIGDSFTNLLGRTFGKTPFFYNPKKKIEGPLYATVLAGMSASFFAPILYSFTAALGALFIESLPLKIGPWEIDDNITIPLVAGGILTGLLAFYG